MTASWPTLGYGSPASIRQFLRALSTPKEARQPDRCEPLEVAMRPRFLVVFRPPRMNVALVAVPVLLLLFAALSPAGQAQLPIVTFNRGDLIVTEFGSCGDCIRRQPFGTSELEDVVFDARLGLRDVAVDDAGLVYFASSLSVDLYQVITWAPLSGDVATLVPDIGGRILGLETDSEFLYVLLSTEVLIVDLATEETSSVPLPVELAGNVRTALALTISGELLLISGDSVISFNPGSGEHQVISSGGLLVEPPACLDPGPAVPGDLAVGDRGEIFVAVSATCNHILTVGVVWVVKVDPFDGSQTLVVPMNSGGGATDAAFDLTGHLVLAQSGRDTGTIERFDIQTGEELSRIPAGRQVFRQYVALVNVPVGTDTDGDGFVDDRDNCALVPNGDQADTDHDGIGDACNDDMDRDGDEFADDRDVCPDVADPDQSDTDGSLIGDACNDLLDGDGDEWEDGLDNCPEVSNADQEETDGDGLGDACDPFPDDTFNFGALVELEDVSAELDETVSDLNQCVDDLNQCEGNPPSFLDADSDGERDGTDACADTLPGAPVDSAGCSVEQFCGLVDVTTGQGRAACQNLDWQNNEPIGNARDCRAVEETCQPVAGACGLGFELALLLPGLMWLRQRRRRVSNRRA